MKKTTTLTFLIACVTAVQLLAQCRLVRVESSDTSETHYLSYDKLGRLSAYAIHVLSEGKTNKYAYRFAYNDRDKVVSNHVSYNDTIFNIRNYIYEGDVMKRIYFITPKDSVLETGEVFYNERGQVTHFFSKKTSGDTFSVRYQYAPEGWLKQLTQQSNKPENSFTLDHKWDANQSIMDDVARIFFAGYAISPMNNIVLSIEPLSVKGNLKGMTRYKPTKEGKLEKDFDSEIFDLKANAEGLWIENKYRDTFENKVFTYRGFYEGCKN